MNKINIEIPKHLLSQNKHNFINFDFLEGKSVLGLLGYTKSGKDFIAKKFIEDYGYFRVAFADNIKKELNLHLKELVCDDILQYAKTNSYEIPDELLTIMKSITPEQIDFFSEDINMKKIIRPYLIWYGEELRRINGKFCWINRALSEDAKGHENIILSDVRRMAELDIFRNSNEFNLKHNIDLVSLGFPVPAFKVNNYSTLLFEVTQLGLTDTDKLTIDTIQAAREQWIVDDVFYVDPRIPDKRIYREKIMERQIKKIALKFGIEKPNSVRTKNIQTNIFGN